jgi:hypothetical protein
MSAGKAKKWFDSKAAGASPMTYMLIGVGSSLLATGAIEGIRLFLAKREDPTLSSYRVSRSS